MRFITKQILGVISSFALLVSSSPLFKQDTALYGLQRRYDPTVEDLRQTAFAFVRDVKALDSANSGLQIAIVGGTALALKYPGFRNTQVCGLQNFESLMDSADLLYLGC